MSYLDTHRVIVCCGAGGVGKTTTSAALGVLAAQRGRRVLVLTIDPSKRLAEALGVDQNPEEPVRLSLEREQALGIPEGGALSAWMLDPKLVSDRTVRRMAKGPEEAERLLQNRLYLQISRMIAGMQEYTAMKALQDFVNSNRYDLVVLDTPPSRNALNFLDAPNRLSSFFNQRILQLFLPQKEGFMRSAASAIVGRVLTTVFGADLAKDLRVFLDAFSGLFDLLTGDAERMLDRLRQDDTEVLLVTSPETAAIEDALFFEQRLRTLGLPFGGFVLNRSHAHRSELPPPTEALLPDEPTHADHQVLLALARFAAHEVQQAERDRGVQNRLAQIALDDAPTVPIPELSGTIEGLDGLLSVADQLRQARAHRAPPVKEERT
jgi:anion-transporting  ArsA/GET3 family ATPase